MTANAIATKSKAAAASMGITLNSILIIIQDALRASAMSAAALTLTQKTLTMTGLRTSAKKSFAQTG